MKLLVDARWQGAYGIARFGREVLSRLPWPFESLTLGRPATLLDPLVSVAAIAVIRPDVYFTPGFCPPLGPTRMPFVMTVHDLIHLDEPQERTPAKSAFYTRIVRPGVRRAAAVVTVSEASRQRLVEWAGIDPAKVVVAPNGVSTAFTPEGSSFSPGHEYLLYVGNDKPHKNVDALLAALSLLGNDAPPLYFAGKGHAAVLLRAQHLGIDDRIRFAGPLSDDELATLYRGASALVFPSRREGFGLPVLEAMACGTPVVANDIAPVREIAGAHALYVDAADPVGPAAGMRRLLGDTLLRADLRSEGLARAAMLTWDRTAGAVASAIQAAAERGRIG